MDKTCNCDVIAMGPRLLVSQYAFRVDQDQGDDNG